MSAAPPSQPPGVRRLSELGAGVEAQVRVLDGPAPLCRRLREMGFCEEARVRTLGGGRLLLCAICGTRVAIDREMAGHIVVEPLDLA